MKRVKMRFPISSRLVYNHPLTQYNYPDDKLDSLRKQAADAAETRITLE
jgi:hypothetical protein